MSIASACFALFRRDLKLAWRRRAEIINPLMFFCLVIVLFPLAIGARPGLLQSIAPAVIWIAVLLATLLSMDGIFRSDFEDGTLEQLILTGYPLSLFILAKIVAHWLACLLPLIVCAPLLAFLLKLPDFAISTLLQTLLLGTPILSVIGAVGVALTVGFRRAGILLGLLVMPFFVPVLIFACSAIDHAVNGLPGNAEINLLMAMLFLAFALGPIPTAAAIKMSIN